MTKEDFRSRYFSYWEMTRSRTAQKLHLNNEPTEEQLRNLQALVTNVLDPLREAWGGPITVTSGFRSRQVNSAVGGAKNSQHWLGQAADIICAEGPRSTRALGEYIIDLHLPFDQLIFEGESARVLACQWIHVSYGPRNRRQVLHKS